jgi:hypothetical protein
LLGFALILVSCAAAAAMLALLNIQHLPCNVMLSLHAPNRQQCKEGSNRSFQSWTSACVCSPEMLCRDKWPRNTASGVDMQPSSA